MDSGRRPGMGRARSRLRTSHSPGRGLHHYALPPSPGTSEAGDVTTQVNTSGMEEDFSNMRLGGGFPRGGGHGGSRGQGHQGQTFDTERGDYVLSKPEGLNKQGTKGVKLNMSANYFRINKTPDWRLYHYQVRFNIDEDRTFVKKKLLRNAFQDLGMGYLFDGQQLFVSKRLEDANTALEFVTKDKISETETRDVTITLKYTKPIPTGAPIYIQLYNILIRKCLFGLKLQEMGRNFFDPNLKIDVAEFRLQLWPGFVTSIRSHEDDLLLCVEVTHKVLRMDSVLQVMRTTDGSRHGQPIQKKAIVTSDLKDTIVMTVYNKKTYHVDDIDYSQTPLSLFDYKGAPITYKDFYKQRYGLEITDLSQPLIISRPSKKDIHRGPKPGERKDQLALLIPELCQSTGLTDSMRSNFQLMKRLSTHLHQGPKERVEEIEKFMKRIQDNVEINTELKNWGLEFSDKLIKVQGRRLPAETMVFGGGKTHPCDDKGDFTTAFRGKLQMVSSVNLNKWVLLVPKRDAGGINNLVQTMVKVATPLAMTISKPLQVIELPDIRNQTYGRALEEVVIKYKDDLQMVFVILPNNKLDLYSAVKKKLAVDVGVPSQCFLSKNVTNKGLMSIATKVVIQMNAKLGGEPWTTKLPLKATMFIGYDVYKGAKGSGRSLGSMVATFSPQFTKYYSTTSNSDGNEEACPGVRADLTKCLAAYRDENEGELPEKIFMYRDGVGEGQLGSIYNNELKNIREEIKTVYTRVQKDLPKLTYIVVTKKINARLFEERNGYNNPAPGTVCDSVITQPERYDFFLISCAARQGTVSPCSYNVLQDDSGLDADKIQLITYKMCHMYFNWSGTIAVPAPCQYAHKLAFLTGMAYGGMANEKLGKLLHFL